MGKKDKSKSRFCERTPAEELDGIQVARSPHKCDPHNPDSQPGTKVPPKIDASDDDDDDASTLGRPSNFLSRSAPPRIDSRTNSADLLQPVDSLRKARKTARRQKKKTGDNDTSTLSSDTTSVRGGKDSLGNSLADDGVEIGFESDGSLDLEPNLNRLNKAPELSSSWKRSWKYEVEESEEGEEDDDEDEEDEEEKEGEDDDEENREEEMFGGVLDNDDVSFNHRDGRRAFPVKHNRKPLFPRRSSISGNNRPADDDEDDETETSRPGSRKVVSASSVEPPSKITKKVSRSLSFSQATTEIEIEDEGNNNSKKGGKKNRARVNIGNSENKSGADAVVPEKPELRRSRTVSGPSAPNNVGKRGTIKRAKSLSSAVGKSSTGGGGSANTRIKHQSGPDESSLDFSKVPVIERGKFMSGKLGTSQQEKVTEYTTLNAFEEIMKKKKSGLMVVAGEDGVMVAIKGKKSGVEVDQEAAIAMSGARGKKGEDDVLGGGWNPFDAVSEVDLE